MSEMWQIWGKLVADIWLKYSRTVVNKSKLCVDIIKYEADLE